MPQFAFLGSVLNDDSSKYGLLWIFRIQMVQNLHFPGSRMSGFHFGGGYFVENKCSDGGAYYWLVMVFQVKVIMGLDDGVSP